MERQYEEIKELRDLLSFFNPGRFPALEAMLEAMEEHFDAACDALVIPEWELDY